MSHLCTMHHPPLSWERIGGGHFGEGIHGGEWEALSPLQNTDNTSASPSTLWGWGTPLTKRRAPSTSLPNLSLRRRSKALTALPPQVCVGETHYEYQGTARGWVTYFQVQVWPNSQYPPWRMEPQTRRWCFVASLVCFTVGSMRPTAPAIPERQHTQVIDSELDLNHFLVGMLVRGRGHRKSLLALYVLKVASVTQMNCVLIRLWLFFFSNTLSDNK